MDELAAARLALGLMDLTSLEGLDTPGSIEALCRRAVTPHGATAGVCVYPAFVGVARATLASLGAEAARTVVVTVSSFPEGKADVEAAAEETRAAVAAGAAEVDTVLPYRSLLAGDRKACERQLAACREACGHRARLKVILETGALRDPALIAEASRLGIAAGADFIKTSTGKVPVNATPGAVAVMLEVIRDSGGVCGLKIAGGVRTTGDAKAYLEQVAAVMGDSFLRPETFRFGASGLLTALLATLDRDPAGPSGTQSQSVSY